MSRLRKGSRENGMQKEAASIYIVCSRAGGAVGTPHSTWCISRNSFLNNTQTHTHIQRVLSRSKRRCCYTRSFSRLHTLECAWTGQSESASSHSRSWESRPEWTPWPSGLFSGTGSAQRICYTGCVLMGESREISEQEKSRIGPVRKITLTLFRFAAGDTW